MHLRLEEEGGRRHLSSLPETKQVQDYGSTMGTALWEEQLHRGLYQSIYLHLLKAFSYCSGLELQEEQGLS